MMMMMIIIMILIMISNSIHIPANSHALGVSLTPAG